MTRGKNTGKQCTKECDYNINISEDLKYCFTHVKQHKEEVQEYIDTITLAQRVEQEKRKQERNSKRKPRDMTREKMVELCGNTRNSPAQVFVYGKKRDKDIVVAVDKISKAMFRSFHMMQPTHSLCTFFIYPCHTRGWSLEEILCELHARGWHCGIANEYIFVNTSC